MSDQPPPGPTDPAPSGAGLPADPPPPPAGPPQPGHPGYAVPGAPGQPGTAYPAQPGGQPPGWTWPAAGGAHPGQPYPGQPPMPGQPYPGQPYPGQPPMPGQPYVWQPGGPGWDPADPLVTPPHAGVGGWFSRVGGALRRGWRLLLPIMLLTQAVPGAVVSVIGLALAPTGEPTTGPDGAPVLPDGYLRDALAFYVTVLVASLLLGLLQNVGWAAGTWVVARQAAGEPVGFGAAIGYGVRRVLGLWGWSLVTSLLIGVGVCFCVLPGIYAAFALALVGPVYLFERQNPVGRSVGMFHQRFGLVLGRLALVAAVIVVGALVSFVLESVGQLPFGAHPLSASGTALGAVAVSLVVAVVVVPVNVAQLIGLVVTYAEQRAHEGPVNAARLAAELG
ncbi:hypothetical protein MRQ36_10590 [Micromonospora sp. R77]|uniref:hypothetical protein n=1 Tax=Micromonospora sp. R77 TaxID=2925836 RepID=UPI001F617171|nr:hypothetical protein [Micromonospora sp. R77]MCI4062998.1 hypothetical protein [Micromonospora sp. R77]